MAPHIRGAWDLQEGEKCEGKILLLVNDSFMGKNHEKDHEGFTQVITS